MKKEEKSFEVILAPTDMLEKELEGVLGGAVCQKNACSANTGECVVNQCVANTFDCGENNCEINCNAFSPSCSSNTKACPPGYILVGCDCAPINGVM